MAKIIVFTLSTCPKCEQLKSKLPKNGFTEKDMLDPEVLTYLRCNNVFDMAAPILKVNDDFFTVSSLFKGDTLNMKALSHILRDALALDVELVVSSLKGEGWDHMAATVSQLFKNNIELQREVNNLKDLNKSLIENGNCLRSRALVAEAEVERLKNK